MMTHALYCPMCRTYLGTHDGITKSPLICDCRKCFKRIIWKPIEEETVIKKIPPRATSSGITFY